MIPIRTGCEIYIFLEKWTFQLKLRFRVEPVKVFDVVPLESLCFLARLFLSASRNDDDDFIERP